MDGFTTRLRSVRLFTSLGLVIASGIVLGSVDIGQSAESKGFDRYVYTFSTGQFDFIPSGKTESAMDEKIYPRGSQISVELIGIPAEAKVKLKYVVGGDEAGAKIIEWEQAKASAALNPIKIEVADEVLLGFIDSDFNEKFAGYSKSLNDAIAARKLKQGEKATGEDAKVVGEVSSIEALLLGIERKVAQRSLLETQSITEAISRVRTILKGVLSALPNAAAKESGGKFLTISDIAYDGELRVEVTPKGEGAKTVSASRRILVARKSGIVTNLSSGVNFIVSPRQTYSTAPVMGSTTNQIVAQRNSIEVLPSLQGNIHVVLEDEHFKEYRSLIWILTLGLFEETKHRIGFTLSPGLAAGNNDEVTGSLGIGVSWFLDRDLKMAVQYGILFRREEELFGGFKVGDGAPTVPFTRSVIRPSFFMGFSYSFGS